ncbi:hypothetical protein [Acrocarpospora corrugata]|uniref:hypothetical protein n=1 Tax=Acrocarpospora corrugata TaxID=35763 RepID=UPI0012D2B259|nr:hypothetical protein [Acrocarpospora corrugata]
MIQMESFWRAVQRRRGLRVRHLVFLAMVTTALIFATLIFDWATWIFLMLGGILAILLMLLLRRSSLSPPPD